jgi:hypothetical protein
MFLTSVGTIVAIGGCPAAAVEISAATQFTIREYESGVLEIDDDPFGFFGYIQGGDTYNDETFLEFDVSPFNDAHLALLRFEIRSFSPGNNTRIARTFDVSAYAGEGAPDFAKFGGGQFVGTLFVEEHPAPNQSRFKTFTLDVTALVDEAISSSQRYVGFRLHNPLDMTPGSDSVPNVDYLFGTAQLSVIVPEPDAHKIISLSATGLAWTAARFKREKVRQRRVKRRP